MVTFSGSFASHPLVGGEVVGMSKVPDAASPILPTSSGSMATFTLSNAGTYPYYCNPHAVSFSMKGAVFVVP